MACVTFEVLVTRAIFELFNHGELSTKYELAEIGQCASNSHDVPSGTSRGQLASCMGGSFADFKPGIVPISSKVIR